MPGPIWTGFELSLHICLLWQENIMDLGQRRLADPYYRSKSLPNDFENSLCSIKASDR